MLKYIIFLSLLITTFQAQFIKLDEPVTNEMAKLYNIRTIDVSQYIYNEDGVTFRGNSGYKKFYIMYDQWGRLIEQVRYHAIESMNIKEKYVYDNFNRRSEKLKYNSEGGLIQHIRYKYNSKGYLKYEKYTAYANTVYTSTHFSFVADEAEDSAYRVIQRIAGIEPPVSSYSLAVNISDDDELNRYIVVGDEKDVTSVRIPWYELPPDVQKVLLNYNGPTKKDVVLKTIYIDKISYKTDSSGNILYKKIINTSGEALSSESYVYNDKGKLISSSQYNSAGSLRSSYRYEYDTLGNIISSFSPMGKVEYIYDSTFRQTGTVHYSSTGSVFNIENYLYNESNNISEIQLYDSEKNLTSRSIYLYNDKGLISEQTRYNSDGLPVELVRFSYTYYQQ